MCCLGASFGVSSEVVIFIAEEASKSGYLKKRSHLRAKVKSRLANQMGYQACVGDEAKL